MEAKSQTHQEHYDGSQMQIHQQMISQHWYKFSKSMQSHAREIESKINELEDQHDSQITNYEHDQDIGQLRRIKEQKLQWVKLQWQSMKKLEQSELKFQLSNERSFYAWIRRRPDQYRSLVHTWKTTPKCKLNKIHRLKCGSINSFIIFFTMDGILARYDKYDDIPVHVLMRVFYVMGRIISPRTLKRWMKQFKQQ